VPTRLVIALMTAASLTGCASDTTPDGHRCIDPPASELEIASPLSLDVQPQPVRAGERASLTFELGDLPRYMVAGAGVLWQCWTAEGGWVDTHLLVRGFGGDSTRTHRIEPGSELFVELIGLGIPNAHPIQIPEVRSGTYRIVDRVDANGLEVTGFVIVEVTSSR
jgi:hypothetical protein